jgi:putative methionine-R-sulfoxide reductase with GAF domain
MMEQTMNTTTSNSTNTNALSQKRFGFWANLPLSRKLLIAFGVLFILAIIIAGVALRGLNQVQKYYEENLVQGVEVQKLTGYISSDLYQARHSEKNFILHWQEEGYDTAYANYVVSHQQNMAEMQEHIELLSTFGPVAALHGTTQAEYETNLAALSQNTDNYEKNFNAIIEDLRERGENENTGMAGALKEAAQVLEARIYYHTGLERMSIALLQLRRSEKDYLLRQDQVNVENVHTYATQLKVQITENDQLSAEQKPELRAMVDAYLAAFDAIVAQDLKIAAITEEMNTAANAVEPLATKLQDLSEKMATDDTEIARANATQTFTISIVTMVVVLGLAIFFAIGIAQQLTRPIIQLTKTAGEIASGNFDMKAEVASKDEIGTLAQTFNFMTAQLSQAFEDVRRRSLAVQTSAQVSRRLSAATSPRQLAVDVVEQVQSAFKYYHTHIYLVDEDSGDLVMAGGTGEAGATMLARGHRLPKGRGLVGRVAETNQPTLIPDVSRAEGWLPNPLLPDTKSEIAIPISSGKQVLGVLDVQQNVVNGLGEEDAELLQSLAGQVAISLVNAQNFEKSRSKAEFETMINTIGQKIQRATTIEDTLQTAIRELSTALGASRVKAAINMTPKGDMKSTSDN